VSQMIGETSEAPSHKWKTVEGTEVESKTTFPPFKSLVLENESSHAKAVPLLIDTGNQLSGIEKRVQNVSEQINWTNVALRGMATQVYQTKSINPEQLLDLQVSTNTSVHVINHLQEKISVLTDKVESTIALKQTEKQKQEDVLDELGQALSGIGKSLTEIKAKKKKEDKPIPEQFLRASTIMSIPSASDLYKSSIVYNPSAKPIQQKFPFFFPPESPPKDPQASKPQPENLQSLVSIRKPHQDTLPFYQSRPSAPDLIGKGSIPEGISYALDWYQEWNLDNLSVGQIRQVIDRMLVAYKIMCMKGKGEVESCKSLIQCFTGSLSKWWEITSSPMMIQKMESENLKDEQGDIVYHADGTAMNNMIGALTTLILEHWCGTEREISDKHETVLMNMKCRKMSEYEQFHKEWIQRIFEVKESKNLLWKQVYMAALPSRFVDYLRNEDTFPLPYETYTWGEIYSIITKALLGLCTSIKMQKSVSKASYLPDQKSVCEQYGIYNTDLQPRQKRKTHKQERNRSNKGHYRYFPKSHYYVPKDIHLKSHKAELRSKLNCWVCGKPGHTALNCPENEAARKAKGKLSEQRAKEFRERKEQEARRTVRFGCNRCHDPSHETNDCPHNPFHPPKLETNLIDNPNLYDSVSNYYSDSTETVVPNLCHCTNKFLCNCTESESTIDSSSLASLPIPNLSIEKLKVCMHKWKPDSEAQMLAHIKNLPDGPLKDSLLNTFVKATKGDTQGQTSIQRPALFLDTSYDKNIKTYMKFNREPKLQELSLVDLAKDVSGLKQEVYQLRRDLQILQQDVNHSYPVDHWARQEILMLQTRLDSIPPPLEDFPEEEEERQNEKRLSRQ
jgi:hypothetical protein